MSEANADAQSSVTSSSSETAEGTKAAATTGESASAGLKDDAAAAAAASGATYLVFHMAEERYAAAVTEIEEVLEWQKITVVPRTPSYLLGIINVRGTLIPVMDLRKRFGLAESFRQEEGQDEESRHILVVRILHGKAQIQLGIVVDTVEGVVDLDPSALEPPPRVGQSIDGSVISGVARHGDRILLVVEPEGLLPKEQLDADFDALDEARRSG
ncbi:MAG: chemotaxis protein CheW [Spirochaetia bacterium]